MSESVTERIRECPLCGLDFAGEECHSSCPMARGCAMVRCPRCGYEFVESGRFVDMLRRWIRRAPAVPHPDGVISILDLPVGATAFIDRIVTASAARLNRLASYGIAAGSEVRLLARRPACVLQCGASSIAVEDDVGGEILVRVSPLAR